MDGRAVAPAAPRRVFFYTVNGKGLGHLMRALAVARAVRAAAPDTRILFATSCEEPGVLWREGFPYVKLLAPEARETLHWARDRHVRLMERQVRSALAALQPHVLVVDSFAYGSVGELKPFLVDMPWQRLLISNLFLLQRDVARYIESIGFYDRVIYPFEAAEAAGHPVLPQMPRPFEFAGPIAGIARGDLMPRAEARAVLGLPAEGRIVLISTGGGGGASVTPILARVAETLPLLPDVGFAVLEPPLGREPVPIAWNGHVRAIRRIPIAPCLAAFDAAVVTAGMNGAAELMVAGLPMVWLPLGAPSFDQARNAARWEARGIGCQPQGEDAAALAAAIRRVLDPTVAGAMRRAMAEVDDGGAARAARAVLAAAAAQETTVGKGEGDATGDAG
ncbi:MAG: hypothetical protein AB7P02_06175 [Alphaproteobacteria bacterium]